MAEFTPRARREIIKAVRKAKYDATHLTPLGRTSVVAWQRKWIRFVNDTGFTIPEGGVFIPSEITIDDYSIPTIYAARVEDFPALTCVINGMSEVNSREEGTCTLANDQPIKAAYEGDIDVGDICGVPPGFFTLQLGYPGFRCWGFSDDGFLMVVRDTHVPSYWGVLDGDLEEGGEAVVSIWIGQYDDVPIDSEIDITAYDWLMSPVEAPETPEEDPDKICAGSKVKIELFSDGYWWVTNSSCDEAECVEPEE